MSFSLSIPQAKVLWVVGALERLATLGMLSNDIPCKVSQEAIDDYLEIDNCRQYLFESDFEIAQIFRCIANQHNHEDVSEEELCDIIELLLHYKNGREDIVKYALDLSFV